MEPQSALPVAPRRVRPSQRPSLPWVLRGEFPSFDGTMALCDSLCPSRRASLPSLGDTLRCACVSLPAVQDTKPRAWGSYAGPHVRTVPQGGNQGLPGSRTTHCPFALFFDPGRTEHIRPIRCDGMAPAMSTTKAPTKIQLSRLNRTALGLAVYASSRALPHATQNSLPAAGQALPDGIAYPQGCYERFLMLLILPSRAFLAQGHPGIFGN